MIPEIEFGTILVISIVDVCEWPEPVHTGSALASFCLLAEVLSSGLA